MKQFFMLLCTSFLVASCSNNLSVSKAESIVEEYLEENPQQGSVQISTGKISHISEETLNTYKKLEADGYLKVEYKEEEVGNGYWKSTKKYHIVSLTEKSQDYVLKTRNSYSETETNYEMRTYSLALDEVSDIFIKKDERTATAKAKFKKKDKTPFFILENDPTDFKVTEMLFYKTEDKGWRLMNEKGTKYK